MKYKIIWSGWHHDRYSSLMGLELAMLNIKREVAEKCGVLVCRGGVAVDTQDGQYCAIQAVEVNV